MPLRSDLPWSIYSRSPLETARHLIGQAGGVDEAHKAVTAAAADMKRPHGKPLISADTYLLLIADAIRRDEGCTDNAALKKVADLHLKRVRGFKKRKDTIVRRLRDKLKGGTLAEFAQRSKFVADRANPDPNAPVALQGPRFVFRVREGE
jgi:hypothetical protein